MLKTKLASVVVILSVTLPSCFVNSETLIIYNWAEYLSEETIEKFERQSGHNIRQVYYDNEGERDRVILSNKKADYDLVIFDEHSLKNFSVSGLLEDLTALPITGKKNQGIKFRNLCGKNGIPYSWGTTGIAYRSSIFKRGITSWQSLFNPPIEAEGRIVMPLDEVDTTSVLLLALGKETNSANLESLKASLDLLKSQMPYLIKYGYGLTYAELRGEENDMAMTMAYSSDIAALIELTGQTDWKYVVPDEGGEFWVDCWAIPEGKVPSQAAIDFLSFMNNPENAAENAEEALFASTNTEARKLFSTEYLKNDILNPNAETLARTYPTPTLSAEALRLRNWLVFSAKSNFDAIQQQP